MNRCRRLFPNFCLSLAFPALTVAAILFPTSSGLFAQQQVTEPAYSSGQTLTNRGLVQVALDGETGKTVFILTPEKAPSPTHSNGAAQAPIYLVVYPTSPSIPADDLDCTVTNCKGLSVLPFADADYGALLGTDPACVKFNGGKPCSQVEGHDHIVGTPFTGGDFNVAWRKALVVFTHTAFTDGNDAFDTRITTVAQLDALKAAQEVKLIELGAPVTVAYP